MIGSLDTIPVLNFTCLSLQSNKRRKRNTKGVCYEDPPETVGGSEGAPPQWKMEFPGGATPGLGLPQSQIMDSGMYCRRERFIPINTHRVV